MSKPYSVLILCTGNSARSQMAEGLLRHDGGDRFQVSSAGLRPGGIRPEAIQVMAELGIDISGHRSKSVEEFRGQHFDFLITVCDHAREFCPAFPGVLRQLHWSIPDPVGFGGTSESRLAAFRSARDQLRSALADFVKSQLHG